MQAKLSWSKAQPPSLATTHMFIFTCYKGRIRQRNDSQTRHKLALHDIHRRNILRKHKNSCKTKSSIENTFDIFYTISSIA
jgi:hypothetical protein